ILNGCRNGAQPYEYLWKIFFGKMLFFWQVVCERKNIREWTANPSVQPVATSRAVMKRDSHSAALKPAATSSSSSPSRVRQWLWGLNSLAVRRQMQPKKLHRSARKVP